MISTPRDVAESRIILRCEVGSRAHGLALEGSDDRDEMGVCVEPPEYVIGHGRVRSQGRHVLVPFEQWVHRTAEEREGHNPLADQRYSGRTPPSQPGDLDLTIYSLRKWARLAAEGNPTVLILLFAEPLFATEAGRLLQWMAPLFASKRAGHRFLGYLHAQHQRLLGRRGQMRVTRTELIEVHGFDTKYAMHSLRLGWQGVEFMENGRLELPMVAQWHKVLMDVRRGKMSFDVVIEAIEDAERDLREAIETSSLPENANWDAIDRFLIQVYMEAWNK